MKNLLYKKIAFLFVLSFAFSATFAQTVKVIDNKGTIREVESSPWTSSGTAIYNKITGNIVIGNGDGTAPVTINPNAALQFTQATKGILVPKVELTATNSSDPFLDLSDASNNGLLVYNTATDGTSPNNVIPGFYYWDATTWKAISPTSVANATNATNTTNTEISNDNSSNAIVYPTWVTGNTDNLPIHVSDVRFSFNPSTGSITLAGDANINGVTVGKGGGNVSSNTAIGVNALKTNTTGIQNTAFGNLALENNSTGNNNDAFGHEALYSNTTGNQNLAFGNLALKFNEAGKYNVGIGQQTLLNLNGYGTTPTTALSQSGNYNTAVGTFSLRNSTKGSFNTTLGALSGEGNTSGYENLFLGYNAGDTNTSGDNNTIIGTNADVSVAALSNATAIGSLAIVSQSNTIQLGNAAVTNVNTAGTLTAGDVTYPKAHGNNGQILSTTGSGNLVWVDPSTNANLTGDVSSIGSATTLATVNSNVGSFGNSVTIPSFTVNEKGLITATSSAAIPTASNSITGLLSNTDWTIFNAKQAAFGSQTANTFYAAPNGSAGIPSFRTIVAADIPILNQNTTGNATTATNSSNSAIINDNNTNATVYPTWVTASTSNLPIKVSDGKFSFNPSTGSITLAGDALINGLTVGKGLLPVPTNTAFGISALANNLASQNTAIGYWTLKANNNGNSNTALGHLALTANTTGNSNTAIGNESGLTNTIGEKNTIIGAIADVSSNNLTNATAIGYGARVGGSNMIQLGADGTNSTTAITNVKTSGTLTAGFVTYPNAHGTSGQVLSTTGSGTLVWATPATGTVTNLSALTIGTSGIDINSTIATPSTTPVITLNVPNASSTARGVVTTAAQTFAGAKTFTSDALISNITVGLGNNKNGYSNVAFGDFALANSTDGNTAVANTGVGSHALRFNTSGSSNTAVGSYALRNNTTGINNTAQGSNTLYSNTTGSKNIAMGTNAGYSNITGSKNTLIGASSDVLGTLENATAIGYNSRVTASNTIQLGDANISNVKTSGTLTAGSITYPNTGGSNGQVLTTDGSVASWTTNAPSNVTIADDIVPTIAYPTWVANTTPSSQALKTTSTKFSFNPSTGDAKINELTIGKGGGNVWTNTAIGESVLSNNTSAGADSGSENTGVGKQALKDNTQGHKNTALGAFALWANTTGYYNTATGYYALRSSSVNMGNTAYGYLSLSSLGSATNGNGNTAIGSYSGDGVTRASFSTFIGKYASLLDPTGSITNATAIGYLAKAEGSNMIQLGNTDVTNVKTFGGITAGKDASINGLTLGKGNNNQLRNTALGVNALMSNSISTGNVPLKTVDDFYALDNVGIGYNALSSNTTGWQNTAIGSSALTSNTTGDSNIAIGLMTLKNNTSGGGNIALGTKALTSMVSGYGHIAIGFNSLQNSIANNDNLAIGNYSQSNNTTGKENVALGSYSLFNNTTGFGNTAIGHKAAYTTQNVLTNAPDGNTTIGLESLYLNTSGDYNTVLGYQALYNNTEAGYNTAIGSEALKTNITGGNNTAIGYQADVSSAALSNATAIGNSAKVNASNKIRLGNAFVNVIEGQVGFSASSDIRLKRDITNSKYGLNTVLQLRPVDYTLKSNNLKQVGFIAQEVQKLVPEVVTGVEGDLEKGETLGLTYGNFAPILTKAIQEQQVQITGATERNNSQTLEIAELKERLQKQETQIEKLTALVEKLLSTQK
jgi:trimeric autotransporter adhesin